MSWTLGSGPKRVCKGCGISFWRKPLLCPEPKHLANYGRILKQSRKVRISLKQRDSTYWLKYRYGITSSEYMELLAKQSGVCAICGHQEVVGLKLSVDHDHKTGKVRGLLCRKCNGLLAFLENSEMDAIEKAYEYLGWTERILQ